MKKIALITTILLAVLTAATSTIVAVDGEREALMALYDSTDGANWTAKAGWGVGNPCDSAWYGVICDADHVTRLNLPDNQLIGPIPVELGNLGSLVELILPDNQLIGPIPAELGSLGSLVELYLSSNQLAGPIPAELGNLSSLLWLNLSSNQLAGPIPAELGNLSSLEDLILYGNQLASAIPAELGNLSSLRNLFLGDNDLVCWQTQAALNWALGLVSYGGPEAVCSYLLYLPAVVSASG